MVDVSTVTLAGVIAYWVWAWAVRRQPAAPYFGSLYFLPLLLISYAFGRLYPGFGMGAVETIRQLVLRLSFLFLFLASASFALRLPHHYSRAAFVIAWLVALFLVPFGRFLFLKIAHRWWWWNEPAVLVGSGEIARRTVQALASALTLGYRPIAVVESGGAATGDSFDGVPVVDSLSSIPGAWLSGVRIALLAGGDPGSHPELVERLQREFRHVIHVREIGDLPVEGVQIRNLGGVLGIEYNNQLLLYPNRFIKRTMDLVLGAVGTLISLPIIAVGAALIKIVAPGPAFFTQRREGLGGRTIRVRKLRTMFVDAEERLETYLSRNPQARREWEQRCKLTNDPRVIPWVGSFLRRFSLDELPQLLHVVTGEMSLVGPRPFPSYHLDRFDQKFRELRCRVRPGLTGLWQVMTRSDGDLDDQKAYDSYYIRNWSLWMDIYILARTFVVVVSGRGAY